ncbi:MAG: hypothetical protein CL927_15970 [Deltaproteobacteria bacterium]|nr:hypothetical protein [Deltaproteobacteria bacterium]
MKRSEPAHLRCWVPLWMLLGSGCLGKQEVDTESPWPVQQDGGGDAGTTDEVTSRGEALDVVSTEAEVRASPQDTGGGGGGDDGEDPTPLLVGLEAEVDGGTVLVMHYGVEIGLCDDFAVVGASDAETRQVVASYENTDCGTTSEYDLTWSFVAPTVAGTWQLSVGDDSTTFEVE